MEAAKLFAQFESVGNNCDFGFVQQYFGDQSITLLRWAGCSLDGLVRALEADFASLFAWENVREAPPSSITDAKYDLYYHVSLAFEGGALQPSGNLPGGCTGFCEDALGRTII